MSNECKHEHEHDHHHGLGHVHVAQSKIKLAIWLSLVILIAEVIGGIFSNSLALLSDAGHLFTDVASLILAFIAIKISGKAPTSKMTFGYHRITILAALFNGLTLIGTAIFICSEAYHRILETQTVDGIIVLIIAVIGLGINLFVGLALRDHADNVNVKSAMLHVFGDALASVGVIISGIIIYFTNWTIVDPVISVVISLIIAYGAVNVLKEVYFVIMEATPNDVDYEKVYQEIQSVKGIEKIENLHIWSMTSNINYMSVHIYVLESMNVEEREKIIKTLEHKLAHHLHIQYTTIQIQTDIVK